MASSFHSRGARDGGGGECQHVNRGTEFLQFFFVKHAKTLLLVDDEQAQVVEEHVVAEQAMRTNDDVHLPRGQAVQNVLLLLRCAQTVQHFDFDGKRLEPLAECAVVLQRQHGCRHEHRHLLVVLHRLEGGTQRYFGFAEAHVATDQAVHGARRFHIAPSSSSAMSSTARLACRRAVSQSVVPRRWMRGSAPAGPM